MNQIQFVNQNPSVTITLPADDNTLRALSVARELIRRNGDLETYVTIWPYTIKASVSSTDGVAYKCDHFNIGADGVLFKLEIDGVDDSGECSERFSMQGIPELELAEIELPEISHCILNHAMKHDAFGVMYQYVEDDLDDVYFHLDLIADLFPGETPDEDECYIEMRYSPRMFQ